MGETSESVATLHPFGPIKGQKWFDQISSQWESQKNRFALIYFGKILFLSPCIWNIPFLSYRLCRPAFLETLKGQKTGLYAIRNWFCLWLTAQASHLPNVAIVNVEKCTKTVHSNALNMSVWPSLVMLNTAAPFYSNNRYFCRCFVLNGFELLTPIKIQK